MAATIEHREQAAERAGIDDGVEDRRHDDRLGLEDPSDPNDHLMDLEGEGVPRGARRFLIAATFGRSPIHGPRWGTALPGRGAVEVVQSAVHGGTIPEATRSCAGGSMRF